MHVLCLIVAVLSVMVASCTPTRSQMQDRFDYSVQTCVGKNYSDSSTPQRCTGTRQPDEVIELASGNRRLVFHDYWGMYRIRREPCRVSLELDGDKVVAASHEGPGCYMPY
jgi:hypothetical protein